MTEIEYHPLEPFLPKNAKLLMLGSFPPQKQRWSMDFYYPNIQNDMWRIFGLIFFNNKDYFVQNGNNKIFDKDRIIKFLTENRIAIGDTAQSVIRRKGNASDNFLQIIDPLDLTDMLSQIPHCLAIVTTGQKASDTLAERLKIDMPKIGQSVEFIYAGRIMKFYRMPSSSRAYPKPLIEKAIIYRLMLEELALI